MAFQKPAVTRTSDGKLSCTYTSEDGSRTRLIADTESQLIEKLSLAHQSAVGALHRSKQNFTRLQAGMRTPQTRDQQLARAEKVAGEALKMEAIYKFLIDTPQYHRVDSNALALERFIQQNNLEWTADNLRFAFESLSSEGRLAEKPTPAVPPDPGPALPSGSPSFEELQAASADEYREYVKQFGHETLNVIVSRGGRQ
jgi:hypothetical protein